MDLAPEILGANVVRALTERLGHAVLTIGKDRLTRSDLATVDCFNFVAARNLSNALVDLGVKSTSDLFHRIAPSAVVLPGVGTVAMAVIGAAFEKYGLGGDTPLKSWFLKHRGDTDVAKAVATIATLKHRASEERRGEKRTKRQRKEARRNTAHRLRTERFTERSARVQ